MPNQSPSVFAGAPQYLLKKEFFDFDFKSSCNLTTTAALVASAGDANTLTIADNGSAAEGKYYDNGGSSSFTLDSVTITSSTVPAPPNTRILIKDQVNVATAGNNSKWNGIYTVGPLDGTTLTLTRATDFDEDSEVTSGAFININQGTVNADTHWVLTTDGAITVGTTALAFTEMSAAVAAAQTAITSIYNTGLKVGRDAHNQFDFSTDNMIKVSVNAEDDEFRFAATGHFHADNDITAFSTTTGSDKKLKDNIKDMKYGLKDILNLRGVEFDWKEKRDGKHDIGFIAQEVQEVIPEVVNEIPDLKDENNKYLGIEYSKIVPILVESIKEQQKQIEELRNEVELLKK